MPDDGTYEEWIKIEPPPDLQALVRRAGERRAKELAEVYDPKNPNHEPWRVSAHHRGRVATMGCRQRRVAGPAPRSISKIGGPLSCEQSSLIAEFTDD
jgi:hypothetical protein